MKSGSLSVVVVVAGLALPDYLAAGPAPAGLPVHGVAQFGPGDEGSIWLSRCGNVGDGSRRNNDDSSGEDSGGEGSGNDDTGGGASGGGDDSLSGAQDDELPLYLETKPIPVRFTGDCDDFGPNTGGLTSRTTNTFVAVISEANATCASGAVTGAYRIDCLRAYYARIVSQLPDTGDYAPVKKALQQAERKLDQIVRQNLDTSAPTITPHRGNKPAAPRMQPLRAVKKSAEKKALAQAEAVVKEAELLIVRSGGDPARREPHYNQIADAVEDNLLILRSA